VEGRLGRLSRVVIWPLLAASAELAAIDGAMVALPRAVSSGRSTRPQSPWFALLLPGSLGGCVLVVTLWPYTAAWLQVLALVAIPGLAALTLGFLMRGSRRWLIGLAPALLVITILGQGGWTAGVASVALTSLSAVSGAYLLVYITPLRWLACGILAMAIADVVLVCTGLLAPVSAQLSTATVPLPSLQSINVGGVRQGYADLFVPALLGSILALQGRAQLRVAMGLTAVLLVFDSLFLPIAAVPQTGPPALMLVLLELFRPQSRLRELAHILTLRVLCISQAAKARLTRALF
jgi:hypothetical protein